jgi:hypothetical protein
MSCENGRDELLKKPQHANQVDPTIGEGQETHTLVIYLLTEALSDDELHCHGLDLS